MDEIFYMEGAALEYAKGRYAVFGDNNELLAQDDDLDVAMEAARAKGAQCPAIVNLDGMREQVYAF